MHSKNSPRFIRQNEPFSLVSDGGIVFFPILSVDSGIPSCYTEENIKNGRIYGMNETSRHFLAIRANEYMELHLILDDGQIFCAGILNRQSGYVWENPARRVPLISIPGFDPRGAEIVVSPDGERITLGKEGRIADITLKTYPDNPFITLSVSLSGVFGKAQEKEEQTRGTGNENAKKAPAKPETDVLLCCPISEKHLKVRTVQLRDVTDANNILVNESSTTVYPRRPLESRGQLFFVEAYLRGEVMMLVKEAPSCGARIAESAYDLRVEPSAGILMSGFGADLTVESEYTPDVPLYSVSFAVGTSAAELERAWRDYYRRDIAANLRDGLVIMSNTWGDRNQDAAVCESFMLGEIEKAKELGITAVQIDDGWQKGITVNSKLSKGGVWGSGYYGSDPDFWVPHPGKFPHSLTPIREAAEEADIKLGLWFSPDLANDYASWEKDASVLLGLHRDFGVRFFKLDGIDLSSKCTETRLLAMMRRVHTESSGRVSFNMDITAMRRWGYLSQRQYGNLFVENRYTDWGNYHPHSTLRSVWMLSRYIPTAKLQMEFLNLRRNPDKYRDDPLAPGLYPMDWAFASVMFTNPLCWMEMTHLSEEDCASLASITSVWKEISGDLAFADVTPLGDEPDGITFTGLRADCGDHGYLLFFRENSPETAHVFSGAEIEGKSLTKLAGTGDAHADGKEILFTAKDPRSFVLLKYE